MSSELHTNSTVVSPHDDSRQKLLDDIIHSTRKSERVIAIKRAYDCWIKECCVEYYLVDGAIPVLLKQLVYVLHVEEEKESEEEVFLLIQALETFYHSIPDNNLQKDNHVHSLLRECVTLLRKYNEANYECINSGIRNGILKSTTHIISMLSRVEIIYHDTDDSTINLKCATELVIELLSCINHSPDCIIITNAIRSISNLLCIRPNSNQHFNPSCGTVFFQVFWKDNILQDVLCAIQNIFLQLLKTSCDENSIQEIEMTSCEKEIDCLYVVSSFAFNFTTVLLSQNDHSPLANQTLPFLAGTSHPIMVLLSNCVLMTRSDSESLTSYQFHRIKYNALNALINWTLLWMKFLHDLPRLDGSQLHTEKDYIMCFTSKIIPYILNKFTVEKGKKLENGAVKTLVSKEIEFHEQKKIKVSHDEQTMTAFVENVPDFFLAKALESVKLMVHMTEPRNSHLWTQLMAQLVVVLKYDISTYGITFVQIITHLAALHAGFKDDSPQENSITLIEKFLDMLETTSSEDMNDHVHRNCCMLSWAYQKLSINHTWLREMIKHNGTVSSLIYLLLNDTCVSTNLSAAATLLNMACFDDGKWNNQIEIVIPALLESALTNNEENVYMMVLNIIMQSAHKNERFCGFLMKEEYSQKVVMIFSQAATPPDPIVVGANKFLQKLLLYTFDKEE